MNVPSLALVLTGVMLNACAQLLLKAGANVVGHFEFSLANLLPVSLKIATQGPIIAGLLCYAISAIVWIAALSRVEVSLAYPMLSLGYVINAFAAWYLFGEALTVQRMLGIGIILAGVFILVRG